MKYQGGVIFLGNLRAVLDPTQQDAFLTCRNCAESYLSTNLHT